MNWRFPQIHSKPFHKLKKSDRRIINECARKNFLTFLLISLRSIFDELKMPLMYLFNVPTVLHLNAFTILYKQKRFKLKKQ